jgi:hypothetical protein
MITPKTKQYVATGRRHNQEVYGIVRSRQARNTGIAYCRVEGRRERLCFRPEPNADEIVLTEPTYVLNPCFAGPFLLWSQGAGREWGMKAVRVDEATPARVFEPFRCAGRPMSLRSCTNGTDSFLVWEERSGRRTRLYLSRLTEQGFGPPTALTDGECNAYDPDCCGMPDGRVAIVHGSFKNGQYIIEMQFREPDGASAAGPFRVSNASVPCIYPSVCTRPTGGVWFSYTALCGASNQGETTFPQHRRYLAQRDVFHRPGQVHCGVCESDGSLLAPLTPPSLEFYQGFVAAMVVDRAHDATRSHVFTDSTGTPHLLMRTHRPLEHAGFEHCPPPLRTTPPKLPARTTTHHPCVAVCSLEGHRWTEPACLIPLAYLDGPVSFAYAHDRLDIAFQEDSRQTGWSRQGEWFDSDGSLAVGVARLDIGPSKQEPARLLPFRLSPVPPPPIENPVLERDTRHETFAAFGQVHTHSNLSVCFRAQDGDVHFNYRFSQDVQHSDFFGITDHAYNMWHTEMLQVRKLADYYYFPGEFVALQAYEWTGSHGLSHEDGPWGHLNPICLEEDDDLSFFTPSDPSCQGGSLQRLWKAHAGKNIVTIPHHVVDHVHPYNWRFFDERFVPVIEIFQDGRGSGEQQDSDGVTNCSKTETDCWALTQLHAGRRFGFVAGGDHRGLARAGLWVRELTRKGIYEALTARRAFATTGLGVSVDLRFGGCPMGGVTRASAGEFELRISSPEPLYEAQIVRCGATVDRVSLRGRDATHRWAVSAPESGEFWYVRVLLVNGELIWTSPIWLD